MKTKPKLLDKIGLLQDLPHERLTLTEPDSVKKLSLPSGLVGTIVHIYESDSPQYLIEFADSQGCEYAMTTLQANEFLVLQYDLVAA